jgi:uncharacterized repeat protein (TIGR03803 family)
MHSPTSPSIAPSRLSRWLGLLCAAALAPAARSQVVTHSLITEMTGNTGGAPGRYPSSPLMIASDGNLYGTMLQGGSSNFGLIFKLTPAGSYSTVRSFTGTINPTPGFYPTPHLIQDGTGNLIGMTSGDVPYGGTSNIGTIFSTQLSGATFTTHATFNGTTGVVKGAEPIAGMIKNGNGYFYGTTRQGGAGNHGVLFKFKPLATSPFAEYTAIIEFTNNGTSNKGQYPRATLLDGGNGFLYGTTSAGGTGGNGTLFKFNINTEALTTLVNFTGTSSPNPGKSPSSRLFKASEGFIYGTTDNGGTTNSGVLFRLNPSTDAVTTLVEFSDSSGSFQGAGPSGGVVEANDGNLYGCTQVGGSGDHGTVYRYNPTTSTFTHKLVEFTNTSGAVKGRRPYASLIKASDGTLYGSTLEGGANGLGTLFKLTISSQNAPDVMTSAATSVTTSAAVLNGTVNPKGEVSTWQFEWGTTTSYGSVAPATAGSTTNGNAAEAVSTSLSGLTAGATYHFRLRGTNSGGTVYGANQTFTASSSPQVPDVVTDAATNVTASSVTLNGTVNPRGSSASWQFEYGTTTSYGSVIPLSAGTTGSGSSAEAVSTSLTGLPPGATIHYRLRATNASGTATGSDTTVTTSGSPLPPAVSTSAASNITDSTATLNGTVNPQGQQTSWQFEYGPTPLLGSVAPLPAGSISGTGVQSVNATISGLSASSTVYFRLTATNAASVNPVFGSTRSFTTAQAPEVLTEPAIGITQTGATLVGTIDPQGSVMTWQFEYGNSISYGTVGPIPPGNTSDGTDPELVTFTLTGLTPGTTIHYRLKGTTAGNATYYGQNRTFTTPQPPTVVTGAALSITASGASLQGTVNPNGNASSWQFDYGTTTAYGQSLPLVPGVTGSGTSPEVVNVTLTGLLPNTTYHYRLRATSSNGTANGSDATFTTSSNILSWRQQYFGIMTNTGDAHNDADPDRDGVVNLLEYGFGMNPTVHDPHLRPLPSYNGSVLIASFTQPLNVNDVTYSAESSTNLINWSPLADSGSGRAHTFTAPVSSAGRDYMKLKVTLIP